MKVVTFEPGYERQNETEYRLKKSSFLLFEIFWGGRKFASLWPVGGDGDGDRGIWLVAAEIEASRANLSYNTELYI